MSLVVRRRTPHAIHARRFSGAHYPGSDDSSWMDYCGDRARCRTSDSLPRPTQIGRSRLKANHVKASRAGVRTTCSCALDHYSRRPDLLATLGDRSSGTPEGSPATLDRELSWSAADTSCCLDNVATPFSGQSLSALGLVWSALGSRCTVHEFHGYYRNLAMSSLPNKSLQRAGGRRYLVCKSLVAIDRMPIISPGEPPAAKLSR